MRVVLQRVSKGKVTIDNKIKGSINKGYVLLVGFEENDNLQVIQKVIQKIIHLRIFEDENDKLNLSILDVNGEILSISQFTLYANIKKGRRPSFTDAAKPEIASPLYDLFNQELSQYIHVETGEFGANMDIDLINDGPITIIIDSKDLNI